MDTANAWGERGVSTRHVARAQAGALPKKGKVWRLCESGGTEGAGKRRAADTATGAVFVWWQQVSARRIGHRLQMIAVGVLHTRRRTTAHTGSGGARAW